MRFWPQSTGDAIREAFAFLPAAHGYRLIADSDAGMGGSLTYRSADLWITVSWDRGDHSVEFSPTNIDGKFDWELIEHLLRGAERYEGVGVPVRAAPVPELAAFVSQYLPEIERRFRDPALPETLTRLAELQAEQRRRAQQSWDELMPRATSHNRVRRGAT